MAEPAYANSPDYRAFWEKLNRGEFDAGEYQRLGKGGVKAWLQATYNPILDLNGKPFKVVKFAIDITDKKKIEQNIKSVLNEVSKVSETLGSSAEKMTVVNGLVTRIHREIPEPDAYGEYIGVAKFSTAGAARLREHYHRCREEYSGKPWREAKVFEKAYKIHLFQEMIERGERMVHVDTPGGYIEVDTQQDFEYAQRNWVAEHVDR